MAIKVLYFAELKEITLKREEFIDISGSSVKDLVEVLFEKYSPLKPLLWDSSTENLKNNVSIAINDVIVTKVEKLSIFLSSGDKVAFLLPISGG